MLLLILLLRYAMVSILSLLFTLFPFFKNAGELSSREKGERDEEVT